MVEVTAFAFFFGNFLKNFWMKCQPQHHNSVSCIFYSIRNYKVFFQVIWVVKRTFLRKNDSLPYLPQVLHHHDQPNYHLHFHFPWPRTLISKWKSLQILECIYLGYKKEDVAKTKEKQQMAEKWKTLTNNWKLLHMVAHLVIN